jgi:hypothetical protein
VDLWSERASRDHCDLRRVRVIMITDRQRDKLRRLGATSHQQCDGSGPTAPKRCERRSDAVDAGTANRHNLVAWSQARPGRKTVRP